MENEVEIEEEVSIEEGKPKLPKKGEAKPLLPKKKSGGEGVVETSANGTEPISPSKSQSVSELKYGLEKSNPFTFDNLSWQPKIEVENGAVLDINPKTIPIQPYSNPQTYVKDLQQRISTGTTTNQDKEFIANQRKANKNFDAYDENDLINLSKKHNAQFDFNKALDIPSIAIDEVTGRKPNDLGSLLQSTDGQLAAVKNIKEKVSADYKERREKGRVLPGMIEDLKRLAELERKLSFKKNETDIIPIITDVEVRTDQSGNLLKKALSRLALTNPLTTGVGEANISMEATDRLEKQPVEFSIGLNGLKYTEPAQYERVSRMIANGEPLSETMIANITAQGAEAKEAIVKDQFTSGQIDKSQYIEENKKIQKVRYDNIVNNQETLRAFLSNGIANLADDNSDVSVNANEYAAKKILGNRWNYTDEEIERYGKAYAQANGIDPTDARVKDAIKYLQDNEGVMILENSIAKAGFARDLAKGLAQPIRGIAGTIEDLGKSKSDVYNEGQSQGNVNVSEQKLDRIKNSWEGTVSDVLEGTGQFLTQAGLAYATSGLIGGAGGAILGRGGQAALAGDIALSDMGAANIVGKTLLNSKDAIATLTTSYIQSYDSNLKQALTYTSDDSTARKTAMLMSGLEGATELFLSPLDIAKGIGKKLFSKKATSKGLINILNDAAIVDKNAAVKNFLKASLKGVGETGKVILAEIGEEGVTQIADYTANAVLNPNSKTFQNRDLTNEMVNTAYQTGLSMALPALISGVGAFKVNNFSKGSLLIAAQNRQQLIDDMNTRLHNGEMTQDEYNEKATIINTAAKANAILPVKNDGEKLNSQEKANYVYSRVSEAVLNRQLKKLEEDESRGVGKIGEGEDATNVVDPEITQIKKKIEKQVQYRSDILSLKPMYFVDNEPVGKAEFNEIMKSPDVNKYDLSVENDNKMQQRLRDIGGKDEEIKDLTATQKEVPAVTEKVEEKIIEPVEGLSDIQEEVIAEPVTEAIPVSNTLQDKLQTAREQSQSVPLTEEVKTEVKETVPSLTENLQAARQGQQEDNSAELADKRAKELLGENVPKPVVPTAAENLQAVREQQKQKDLEQTQSAAEADKRVQQMKLDKIPMTEAATKALAKMDKVKGKKLGVYRAIAKSNPKGFLKEVAKQAQGILSDGTVDTKNAMKQAVSNYTKDVVDEALAMFPLEESPKQESKSPTVSSEVVSPSTVSEEVGSGIGDVDATAKALKELDNLDEINKNNTADNYNIDDVVIPDGIEKEMYWQEKLVHHVLDKLGIDYKKEGSKSSASTYFKIKKSDGEDFKLRVADHSKKYDSDGNIEYDKNTTVEDIVSDLKDQLPYGALRKENTIAEAYHKAKADGTNPELVKAVEQSLKETPKAENKPIQSEEAKMPEINISNTDSKLFSDISNALSVVGKKNQQVALDALHTGKKAKYTKEQVDAAIAINKDFEKIVSDMQKDDLLTKECKT